MKKTKDSFVVLPYLSTSGRVRIRGMEFRSSRDLDGLPPEAVGHLRTLTRLFYQGSGERIGDMACAYLPAPAEGDARVVPDEVTEAHLLISYLYSHPHPTGGVFLSSEHSTIYLFWSAEVPNLLALGRPREEGENSAPGAFVAGYEGVRSGPTWLTVTADSLILPEPPSLRKSLTADLYRNLIQFSEHPKNWALTHLCLGGGSVDEAVREKVFLALQWYARSCREAISEAESLLDLAIAFESLFRLPPGELTERFREAILTLLGPVPRLAEWIDQFYDARSKTVHEGRPLKLNFNPGEKARGRKGAGAAEEGMGHRPLREYGLRVFRLCLNAIVSGATMAEADRLGSLFVHNQERLERICRALDDEAEGAQARLDAVCADVRDLSGLPRDLLHFERGVELKTVEGVAKRLLALYRATSPPLRAPTLAALEGAVDRPRSDEYQRLEQLRDLGQLLAKEDMPRQPVLYSNFLLVTAFLDYATGPAFTLRVLPKL